MGDIRDVEVPGDTVSVRELWHLEFREDDTYPWKEVGTHREDAVATLRTYDYWKENHPTVEVRLLQTVVEVVVADPEILRDKLRKETADRADPVVPSQQAV